VLAIDLPAGTGVKTVPANCATDAGRVNCSFDEVVPGYSSRVSVDLTLVAPASASSAGLLFSASVSEREEDFYAGNNRDTISANLYKNFVVTSTANAGAGSLRQAILDLKNACAYCA